MATLSLGRRSYATGPAMQVQAAGGIRVRNLADDAFGDLQAGVSTITANAGYPNLTLVSSGEATLRFDSTLTGAHVWGISHSSGSLYFQHATMRPFGGTIISPLIIGPTGGMTLAGNILGPSIFQVRADTYLDLNINGTTLLGIGSSTLDVAGTVRPTVDLGQDLGTSGRRFNKLYAASVGDPASGRSLTLDGGYGSMLIDYYASRSRWMGKNAEPISIQSNAASGTALVQFLNGGTSIPVSIFGDRLLVKGLAGQTSNLQEWQDSTGAVKAFVAPNGKSIACKDGTYGFQLSANSNAYGADGATLKSFDGSSIVSFTASGFNGTYNAVVTGSGGLLDAAQTAYRAILNKYDAGQLQVHSGGGFTWGVSTGNQRVESPDTGIWRLAANSIGFGSGTAGTAGASITAGAATLSSITCPWQAGDGTGEQFGYGATTNQVAVAVGRGAFNSAPASVCVGYNATTSYAGVGIGYSASAGWSGVAIGFGASSQTTYGYGGVAVGYYAFAHDTSIAIGNVATSGPNQCYLGSNATMLLRQSTSARWTQPATGQRNSEVGDGSGSVWQTGYREEYNATGIRCGFYNATPIARQEIDSGSATLAADLLAALTNLGLVQAL